MHCTFTVRNVTQFLFLNLRFSYSKKKTLDSVCFVFLSIYWICVKVSLNLKIRQRVPFTRTWGNFYNQNFINLRKLSIFILCTIITPWLQESFTCNSLLRLSIGYACTSPTPNSWLRPCLHAIDISNFKTQVTKKKFETQFDVDQES